MSPFPCESFLSLAAAGLLYRMREIARMSSPPGYLRVGRRELTPEQLVVPGDKAYLPTILVELADFDLIRLRFDAGRRYVVLPELLQEEAPPESANVTELRSDGYREWSEAYQPVHESNCPAHWDRALAAGWEAERIIAVARWYSLEQWRKNEKRMRATEFFRQLKDLEKQYLEATQEERDGSAVWQRETIAMFSKKNPEVVKGARAA